MMELIKVAEEAEGEAGFGLKFAVWDGAPNWNELEALNGGTETFPCCRNIAAQGSFDAKIELQSFVNVKYEKVAESVRDVQKKFREDREYERGVQEQIAERVAGQDIAERIDEEDTHMAEDSQAP